MSSTGARRAGGFTLLEMMVALGILSVSLVWMIEATTNAIRSENHAKLITTATFLARQRMVQLEDDVMESGFTDETFGKEEAGNFEDKGFKRFQWKTALDTIELPNLDQAQSAARPGAEGGAPGRAGLPAGAAALMGGAGAAGVNPATGGGGLAGAAGGLLASQFGTIKNVLEHGIRRARVNVLWFEGKNEYSVELVQYLTDPRRVDQAAGVAGAGLMGTAPGAPSGPGAASAPGAAPAPAAPRFF